MGAAGFCGAVEIPDRRQRYSTISRTSCRTAEAKPVEPRHVPRSGHLIYGPLAVTTSPASRSGTVYVAVASLSENARKDWRARFDWPIGVAGILGVENVDHGQGLGVSANCRRESQCEDGNCKHYDAERFSWLGHFREKLAGLRHDDPLSRLPFRRAAESHEIPALDSERAMQAIYW